ncbi:MAG: restriction endonuclease subunit S [Candidatus Woesearchaeota archaeon]
MPKGWVWVRLIDILNKLTDGTHHSPPNTPEGEFMYITAKNIKDNGVDLSNITYVSKKIHDEIYSRCNPELGDILYIKDGATTGIVAINNMEESFSMLSSVALLKPSQFSFNQYLLWVLKSPVFYNYIRDDMSGAAITRVTLVKMKKAILPFPPLAEQKRIVKKVNQLMSFCDELGMEIRKSQTNATRLMDAVLRDAFEV